MDQLLHVLNPLHRLPDITHDLHFTYQIMEIFGSGSWSIGHAAHSLKYFSWNHLRCVNKWNKVRMIDIFLQHYYVHIQQFSINGRPIGLTAQLILVAIAAKDHL
jgi:hypothetical protein